MMGFNELNELFGLVNDKIAEIVEHREDLLKTINGENGYITEDDIQVLQDIRDREMIRLDEMIHLKGTIKLEMQNVLRGTK